MHYKEIRQVKAERRVQYYSLGENEERSLEG